MFLFQRFLHSLSSDSQLPHLQVVALACRINIKTLFDAGIDVLFWQTRHFLHFFSREASPLFPTTVTRPESCCNMCLHLEEQGWEKLFWREAFERKVNTEWKETSVLWETWRGGRHGDRTGGIWSVDSEDSTYISRDWNTFSWSDTFSKTSSRTDPTSCCVVSESRAPWQLKARMPVHHLYCCICSAGHRMRKLFQWYRQSRSFEVIVRCRIECRQQQTLLRHSWLACNLGHISIYRCLFLPEGLDCVSVVKSYIRTIPGKHPSVFLKHNRTCLRFASECLGLDSSCPQALLCFFHFIAVQRGGADLNAFGTPRT